MKGNVTDAGSSFKFHNGRELPMRRCALKLTCKDGRWSRKVQFMTLVSKDITNRE